MSQQKITQTQLSKNAQIQALSHFYGIVGNALSTFECYANKHQTDPSLHSNVFSYYNNFNSGNTKTKQELKMQMITQLEIFKLSYKAFKMQFNEIEFQKDMTKETIIDNLHKWSTWVDNEDKKYYESAIGVLQEDDTKAKSYKEELKANNNGDSSNNKKIMNPNTFADSVGVIYETQQRGENAVKKYNEEGIVPKLEINSNKVGDDKLNKAGEAAKKRKEAQMHLDELIEKLVKDIQQYKDKDKSNKGVTCFIPMFHNLSKVHNDFVKEYQFYIYNDKPEEFKQRIQIIETFMKGINKETHSELFNNIQMLIEDLNEHSHT